MDHPDIVSLVDKALQGGRHFGERHVTRIRLRWACKELHGTLPRLGHITHERVRKFEEVLVRLKGRWRSAPGTPRILSCRYNSIIATHIPWVLCRHLLPCSPLLRCPRCELTNNRPRYDMFYRAQDFLLGTPYFLAVSAFCVHFLSEGFQASGKKRWYYLGVAALSLTTTVLQAVRDRRRHLACFTTLRYIAALY